MTKQILYVINKNLIYEKYGIIFIVFFEKFYLKILLNMFIYAILITIRMKSTIDI